MRLTVKKNAPSNVPQGCIELFTKDDGAIYSKDAGGVESGPFSIIPPGTIVPYAGSSAPSGWLLCYGQTVSRTAYAALFAAIGTAYGAGDGSTTFLLPDVRGRVAAGRDDMGGTAANRLTSTVMTPNGNTLGATGGTQTHTLTAGQMPAHTHDVDGYYRGSAGSGYDFTSGSFGRYTATQSAGGDQAHPNTQPSIILNYIIKT